MLNNLRSDLYRLVKGRAMYVSLIIILTLFFLMQSTNGVKSDTLLASYDSSQGTLLDFMYYFPKSLFFVLAITIVLALFRGEEFSNGFIKNVYTSYRNRLTLLLSRCVLNLLISFIFWLCVTLMIVLMNITVLHDASLSTMNLFDYGMYVMLQMLILCAAISFVDFIIYTFRNKTIAVVVAIGYASSLFYMLHMLLISYLPSLLDYSSYTLAYISGNLPMIFDFGVYSKTFLLAISSLLLYTIGSNFILKKKDLL